MCFKILSEPKLELLSFHFLFLELMESEPKPSIYYFYETIKNIEITSFMSFIL